MNGAGGCRDLSSAAAIKAARAAPSNTSHSDAPCESTRPAAPAHNLRDENISALKSSVPSLQQLGLAKTSWWNINITRICFAP